MANTNTGEIMLKMTDIHKAYDNLEVLKGIDIEVRRGEVLAIIGPSGSGKSTLLRCINKLETIDKGSIAIKDKFLVQTKDGEAVYASGKEEREILSSTGMVFKTSPVSSGSRADVGSSNSIISGFMQSALAIATRCC